MNERLKFQGRLAEKELEAKTLKLRIEGMIESIRSHLDPFENIENLKSRLIAGQAVDLSEYHTMYMEVLDEIRLLKKELGMK
jgi:hypothetical protein